MTLHLGGKKLDDIYIGGKKVTTIYKNGQKIYASYLATGFVLYSGDGGTGKETVTVELSKPMSKLKTGLQFTINKHDYSFQIVVQGMTGTGYISIPTTTVSIPLATIKCMGAVNLINMSGMSGGASVPFDLTYNKAAIGSSVINDGQWLMVQKIDDTHLEIFTDLAITSYVQNDSFLSGAQYASSTAISPMINTITAY